MKGVSRTITFAAIVTASAAMLSGCMTSSSQIQEQMSAASDIPRELQKVSHPAYRVAPPDVLVVEALQNTRPASDPLRVNDTLAIRLGNPEPLSGAAVGGNPTEQQIRTQFEAQSKFLGGEFRIQPDGTVNLGPVYGRVKVEGFTPAQAETIIREYLKIYTRDAKGRPAGIANPRVSVTLVDVGGLQQIAGQHLVRPDGTVSLGIYGSVHVAGKTLDEAKIAVEAHLQNFLYKPRVSVDVLAYNSQAYYVVTDGGGFGEQVMRLPCTGNETVLDAISNIEGLSRVSSKRIWLARPTPAGNCHAQVFDVNWREITQEGITTTNYQLLPGDRIYIAADPLISFDNFVAKLISPFERIFGFTLLGHGTVRAIEFGHRGNAGGLGGGGLF
jgi:polysaccharide biosynthesis/export protein